MPGPYLKVFPCHKTHHGTVLVSSKYDAAFISSRFQSQNENTSYKENVVYMDLIGLGFLLFVLFIDLF